MKSRVRETLSSVRSQNESAFQTNLFGNVNFARQRTIRNIAETLVLLVKKHSKILSQLELSL